VDREDEGEAAGLAVLRQWREIANGGRFPCRDEIESWMRGEDGVNCLLIAVESPIELSHFLAVGMNLGIALCPTDTLAGVLLHIWRGWWWRVAA
jgi:hypothetical protein